jgi:hypothetical protein
MPHPHNAPAKFNVNYLALTLLLEGADYLFPAPPSRDLIVIILGECVLCGKNARRAMTRTRRSALKPFSLLNDRKCLRGCFFHYNGFLSELMNIYLKGRCAACIIKFGLAAPAAPHQLLPA